LYITFITFIRFTFIRFVITPDSFRHHHAASARRFERFDAPFAVSSLAAARFSALLSEVVAVEGSAILLDDDGRSGDGSGFEGAESAPWLRRSSFNSSAVIFTAKPVP
jgi:hypothetical protein